MAAGIMSASPGQMPNVRSTISAAAVNAATATERSGRTGATTSSSS